VLMVARATAAAVDGSSRSARAIAATTGIRPGRSGAAASVAVSREAPRGRMMEAVTHTGPVELLGGLVRARGVTARLEASREGDRLAVRDDGSGFDGLFVAGYARVRDDVAPDTELVLAGVGTLRLRHLTQTGSVAQLCMIELRVAESSESGLRRSRSLCVGEVRMSLNSKTWYG
jgi:hypothetical protein